MSKKSGYLIVICGPMFSGKTEELLREVNRFRYSPVDNKYLLFKPEMDTRYSEDEVVSHNNKKNKAINISTPEEILEYCIKNSDIKNIAIDEIQFLDERSGKLSTVELCHQLKLMGKLIIVSGLDMNFKGEPFLFMGNLMAIANKIKKLHAYCSICGEKATMSYKLASENDSEIDIGEKDKYEPRCFLHWSKRK